MADPSVKLRALIWRASAVLSVVTAILTAYGGNAMCFVWWVAAGLEWKIADLLMAEKEDNHDAE